jgi:hypothetical protein
MSGRRGDFETGGRCPNDVQLGCDPDVSDAPIKAFRTRSDDVMVVASCDLGSRAFTGPSLGQARHSCNVYFNSTLDYDMSMSACREWIQSPFTFPNGSTYALTHMEYHNESNQVMLWSSVTLLTSHDGGQSWQHSRRPPGHIVATAPFKYDPAWQEPVYSPVAAYGFRSPSNIVQSGGMFYAFVTSGWTNGPAAAPVHGQAMGACLMRTADLTDPASWRAWGGASFNVSLAANAYVDDAVVPSEHICAPLTDMTYISLLYSTFYKAHIIVGTSSGNDAAGWSFQIAEGKLSAAKWGPQIEIAPRGFVQPGGNASQGRVHQPVAGKWARAEYTNGTLGDKIWWLSPKGTKHWDTLGCTPCGVPTCTAPLLQNVPARVLDAHPEGPHFSCRMIGGGGRGVVNYIYPSLMDQASSDPNFATVGEMATLYVVTDDCIAWSNATGVERCSPFDSDGIVHRGVVKMPVAFKSDDTLSKTGALAPPVVGWDGQWLSTLKQEIASAHGIRGSLLPALTALRLSADSLLSLEAPSVVTAGSVPLPGTGISPHDMWYLSTYAWPCGKPCNISHFKDCSHWWQMPHYKSHGKCNNLTGMPWEQHDGYVQPKDISDMAASDAMSDAVTTLALAHYLLGHQTFGEKAVSLLNVWFVAEETAMTPNVEHAAIIPGVTNGSSAGIIVTSHRWNSRLTDSIALLASTAVLPSKIAAKLARWNAQYLEWILTSRNGQSHLL